MTEMNFIVEGEPKPWTVYIPGKGAPTEGFYAFKGWQDQIKAEAHNAMKGRTSFLGPIHLKLIFSRGFPNWAPRSPTARARWTEKHLLKKPDVGNYTKACEDAMSGVVYRDDNQVISCLGLKAYGDRPHTLITISTS